MSPGMVIFGGLFVAGGASLGHVDGDIAGVLEVLLRVGEAGDVGMALDACVAFSTMNRGAVFDAVNGEAEEFAAWKG